MVGFSQYRGYFPVDLTLLHSSCSPANHRAVVRCCIAQLLHTHVKVNRRTYNVALNHSKDCRSDEYVDFEEPEQSVSVRSKGTWTRQKAFRYWRSARAQSGEALLLKFLHAADAVAQPHLGRSRRLHSATFIPFISWCLQL